LPPRAPRQNPTPTRIITRGSGRDVRPAQFVRDIIGELRKVTWPTREEAVRLTGIVIAISVAIGVLLGLLDLVFSQILGVTVFRG
jgi:preprotein translocase subunit SecE